MFRESLSGDGGASLYAFLRTIIKTFHAIVNKCLSSCFVMKQCRDKNPGYKPDVIIPLPYPKKLTDNIDEWVLWVAKDLKR